MACQSSWYNISTIKSPVAEVSLYVLHVHVCIIVHVPLKSENRLHVDHFLPYMWNIHYYTSFKQLVPLFVIIIIITTGSLLVFKRVFSTVTIPLQLGLMFTQQFKVA